MWCFCAETKMAGTYHDLYTLDPCFSKVLFNLFSDLKDKRIAEFSLLTR